MNDFNYPLVSIITVNFNGRRFLKDLFNSIANLEYPKNRIELILVDNNSSDGSYDFVRKNFPEVNILKMVKNCGYSGGNNAGFKKAKGSFIALINNDCIVEKRWLKELVNVALEKAIENKKNGNLKNFGAVCSKVLFFFRYIPLEFVVDKGFAKISNLKIKNVAFNNLDNKNDIKNSIFDNSLDMLNSSIKFISGFLPSKKDMNDNYFCWVIDNDKDSIVAIPVTEQNLDFTLEFEVSSELNSSLLEVFIVDPSEILKRRVEKIYETLIDYNSKKVRINFSDKFKPYLKDIINSCGLEINSLFYARDRGFNSFDNLQFREVEEVFSPSGSSLLVNKELLNDVGYFDDDFFTYYEDMDLFWRARLKGWKIYFTPNSVARHYHCGTSKEWSYSFTYHVLRNRIITIFKNGWWLLFFKNFLFFFISTITCISQYLWNTFLEILFLLKGKTKIKLQRKPDIPARLRVSIELFYWIAKKIPQRIKIRKKCILKDMEIKKWIKKF